MQTMCPSCKCVNLYGGFSARDRDLKGKCRQSGGCSTWDWKLHFLQHLGARSGETWQGEASAAPGSPMGRGHVARGGPRGQLLGIWGSHGGSGTVGSLPHGLTEPLAAACGVGELAAAGPSCAAPAFPLLFIARHVRLLPQPRSQLPLPQPWGGGRGATPCPNRGNTLQGMGEWGQFQPGLLQSPLSRISPLAEACSQLAAKQAPSSPQNPFPSCDLGVLGSPHHHHAKLCCPCSWDPAPERAASPGWRSSAREESTCFQAQGNWSTLSFRCL